jgi:hypothetical protein
MRGTNEKLSRCVKKAVRLEIHFHGHMAATVQVSMNHPLKTDGKCPAGLAAINDIESNCQASVAQVI